MSSHILSEKLFWNGNLNFLVICNSNMWTSWWFWDCRQNPLFGAKSVWRGAPNDLLDVYEQYAFWLISLQLFHQNRQIHQNYQVHQIYKNHQIRQIHKNHKDILIKNHRNWWQITHQKITLIGEKYLAQFSEDFSVSPKYSKKCHQNWWKSRGFIKIFTNFIENV